MTICIKWKPASLKRVTTAEMPHSGGMKIFTATPRRPQLAAEEQIQVLLTRWQAETAAAQAKKAFWLNKYIGSTQMRKNV